MHNRFHRRKIFLIPFFILAALSAFGFIVMELWNHVLVQVAHVSIINFWQALGLLALAKILFGGFRGGPMGRYRWNREMGKKWMAMTPEEREQFRSQWKSRCAYRFRNEKPAEPQA